MGACGSFRFFLLLDVVDVDEEVEGEEVPEEREEAEVRVVRAMGGVCMGVEKADAETDDSGVGDCDGSEDDGSDDSVVVLEAGELVLDVGADEMGELMVDGKGEADTEVVSDCSGEVDSEGVTVWSMTVKQWAHWKVVAPAGGDSSEGHPMQRTSGPDVGAIELDMLAAVEAAVECVLGSMDAELVSSARHDGHCATVCTALKDTGTLQNGHANVAADMRNTTRRGGQRR